MRNQKKLKVGVPVMGKGATNHIHRPEVIDAFLEKGVELYFFVRPDYFDILQQYPSCHYIACDIPTIVGRGKTAAGFFEYWRNLYPARDTGRRIRRNELNSRRSCMARFRNEILAWGACSRKIMQMALRLEEMMLHDAENVAINENHLDCMLLLGIGTHGTQPEALFARWARHNDIPVVQVVANYDGLSSKGFRGTDVGELLVWGPAMRDDAVKLQGIPESQVKMIGALRYDHLFSREYPTRKAFLHQLGLDPSRKIILFAGGRNEYHYFEMLAAFETLSQHEKQLQLVIRVYPKKGLLRSAAMRVFIRYARSLNGVYVSIADPSFEDGVEDREVLAIEEEELWSLLKYCDVVVNLYSTIALEACLFDKPIINMWYFGNVGMTVQQPIYTPYPEIHHIRKFESYGAAEKATTREELIDLIHQAIENPEQGAEQRSLAVTKELGPLDGKVKDRLVDFCCSSASGIKSANQMRAA
jgi:hypothetical protein